MLFLYLNVEKDNYGKRPHVLRSSDDLRGETPDWESDFCPPFSEEEDDLIRKVLIGEHWNSPPDRGHYGWFRFPEECVERLILGCQAEGVDLQVVDWEKQQWKSFTLKIQRMEHHSSELLLNRLQIF